MPAVSKQCAICDVVFPTSTALYEIVSHSALCVHSFCERNSLDHCMCISCSGHHKAARIDRTEHTVVEPLDIFTLVVEPLSQVLPRNRLLKISTLSKTIFSKVRPVIESTLWFSLKGTFKFYKPMNMIAAEVKQLEVIPKQVKQVWFAPSEYFFLPFGNLPDVVTHMSLGTYYNEEITHWPASLKYLDFSNATPALLSALPPTLETLKMAHKNYGEFLEVPKLPQSLHTISVGNRFKFTQLPPGLKSYTSYHTLHAAEPPLPTLPSSLTTLRLPNYKHPISLPPNLRTLEILDLNLQTMQELPASLTSLTVDGHFHDIPLLPNLTYLAVPNTLPKVLPPNLTSLLVTKDFNSELPPLPPTLRFLMLGRAFNTNLPLLPESLEHLNIGDTFKQQLPKLPPNLKSLTLGDAFSAPLPELPSSLTYLKVGKAFGKFYQPGTLPPNLKQLSFGDSFCEPLGQLPSSLKNLAIGVYQDLDTLPSQLEHLSLGSNKVPPNLPPTLKTLRIFVEIEPSLNTHFLESVRECIDDSFEFISFTTPGGLSVEIEVSVVAPPNDK